MESLYPVHRPRRLSPAPYTHRTQIRLPHFWYVYGMPAVRAQVILHTVDAFPANYVTNSWAFMGTDPVADATALTAAIKAFYAAWAPTYMSNLVAQNGHEVKYYDLPGPRPNYPVLEQGFNFTTAPGGAPLPSELSCVLTIHGTRTPGFPQSRRRGRLYLGPLGTAAQSGGRPVSAFMTALTTAAIAFKSTVDGLAGDTAWAVWSVTDGAAVGVSGGWVDNAMDVQRRRGVEPTSRTTWS